MLPTDFSQANTTFGPPADMDDGTVLPLRAYAGEIKTGALQGQKLVVTAWKPTTEELLRLNAGGALFVSVLGGLSPHFVTADFREATNPR